MLPLIARRLIASSSLLTPKDAHMLGGQHTLKFAWARVRGHVKQQSRNVEQTVMHVRLPWIRHSGTPLLFFLSNLTFLLFFYYCYFLFFLSIFGS